MSFSKALQKRQEIPGQQEWTAAYELYCKQCALNKQLRKQLKLRTDDAAALLLFRQKEEFSHQCQEFSKASDKWAAQQIQHKLKARGVSEPSIGSLKLAEILDIKLANNGKDLAELERDQLTKAKVTSEEIAKRTAAAQEYLEYLEKKTGYKPEAKPKYDPTFGDNDPLPESVIGDE